MTDNKRHAYSAVPTSTSRGELQTQEPGSRRLRRPFTLLLGSVVILATLAVAAIYRQQANGWKSCLGPKPCRDIQQHLWGQYSPFFPVPSAIDAATPAGCQLTFGLVLSRHGSRYPTAKKAEVYRSLVDHIQSSVNEFGTDYAFIEHAVLDPTVDRLTAYGEQEMVDSGLAFFRRYEALARGTDPFTRASGSDRVVMSAQNFTQGFYAAQGKNVSGHIADILVVPESDSFNNSLDHGSCPAFEDGLDASIGRRKQKVWMEIWAAPIRRRLNANLPGANLSLEDSVWMMDLCPFSTVAAPNATLSDFCQLFSPDEWRDYDYMQSLGKWYGYGSGNSMGATQGVGYVNELVARLTGRAVHDNTTTNSTLDSSPETFPLDRILYADFSHDNSMMSIFAALGLYNETRNLPVKQRLSPHNTCGYSAAWTVPFAGRMYVEKMRCGSEEEELVRILVNGRVVPLQGCGADRLGRCKLGAFVDSLSFARTGGRWDACFV